MRENIVVRRNNKAIGPEIKSLRRWRLAGIFTMTILGFGLHFLYSWTNESIIAGIFTPVNESVWEHLKLGYWSLVLFSIAEFIFIYRRIENFCVAKIMAILALEMTIVIIFYGYTFIVGKDIFWIDILSYFLGVVFCQYISYNIYKSKPFSDFTNRISLVTFILLAILFGILTFYPPHTSLFKDPISHSYGICREK